MSVERPMRFRAIVCRVVGLFVAAAALAWLAALTVLALAIGEAAAAPPEPICMPGDVMPAPEGAVVGVRLGSGGPARWMVMVDEHGGWFLFSRDDATGEACLLDMGGLFELGDGLVALEGVPS